MADEYWEHNGQRLKRIALGDGTFAQAFSLFGGVGTTAPIRAHTSLATVQAASAYATGDLVGGLQSFPAVAALDGAGIIRTILVGDQAKNAADDSKYYLTFFESEPTLTTFTENAPLDIADADLPKVVAVVFFDASAGIGRQVLFADNALFIGEVAVPFQLDGETLYLAMTVLGFTGPTFVAPTDLFVRLLIERV